MIVNSEPNEQFNTVRTGRLGSFAKKQLSLYVHIPFCLQKCRYCDFHSGKASKEEQNKYIEMLLGDIKKKSEEFKKHKVITVFIGGGTPSILEAVQMEKIVLSLREHFDLVSDAEISIEMNPKTVTREKLTVYKRMGINRLSIGLQSTDKEQLKTLGRIHTYEDFLETYQMAREAGFRNINIDLMQAIPGQTYESFVKGLHAVCKLHPEHISAYSLIVEEGTDFYEQMYEASASNLPQLADEEEERKMYHATKSILESYGYHRYEISNYAKKGYECKHNLVYWRRGDYLGIGEMAASLIGNVRLENNGEYRHELSEKEQMEEFMFLGLRCMEGVSKMEFYQVFHKELCEVYKEPVERLKREGLLAEKGDNLYLTEQGIDLSNQVFVEFLFD